MKKNVFFFFLMVGLTMMSVAQVTEEEIKNAVKEKQNEFLSQLKSLDDISKIKYFKGENSDQFWIKQGDTLRYGGNKKEILESTMKYKKVKDVITNEEDSRKKQREFSIEGFTHNKAEFWRVPPTKGRMGNKKGYYVNTDVKNCRTKLSCSYFNKNKESNPSQSNACYDLTPTWFVTTDFDKGGNKTQEVISKVELYHIEAEPNTNAELLKNLNGEVNRLIKEWYNNNVPTYFADKLMGESIINYQLDPEKPVEQKIKELDNRISLSSMLPSVKIYVDPQKHMSEDSTYVENSTAIYTFTPKEFVIRFKDTEYKHGELEVSFGKGQLTKPQTLDAVDRNTEIARHMSRLAKEEFLTLMEDYTNAPDAEKANRLKSMFAENAQVEIAYYTPNEIQRETRESSKYVSRLNHAKVEIEKKGEPEEPEVIINEVPWKASFPFTQKAVWGKNCDHTKKRAFMERTENGLFKIVRIEVEGDPQPCE